MTARELLERYEDWYARRLEKKPVGAIKKLSVPSDGLTGKTLSGVLFDIHIGVLERCGWQRVQTAHVTGPGFSTKIVQYRKQR